MRGYALERLSTAPPVEDYEALLPWNCSPTLAWLSAHSHLESGGVYGALTNNPDFAATYISYFVINGAVTAPQFGDKAADSNAFDLLTEL